MKQRTHSEATMDSRRRKSTSGDSFSFPSTPNPESDFEFESLTPDSPSSDPCRTSPADHLFFNGRLQPHSFPLFQHHHHSISTTSRTSSISSKDSLMSSRSNSINSRGSSSCSSSARTSASDGSERRLLHSKLSSLSSSASPSCKGVYMGKRTMVSAHPQVYGCSQRWQYLTPVPALNRDASKKRTGEVKQKKKEDKKTKKKKKMMKKKNKEKKVRLRFGRKILRWFVMACKECHAMEPSKIKKKHIMSQQNVNT
ncbi:hypothetical protein AAHE18_03G148800 [Arachis hypogaea]|uniref:Uncharacterized protein n=1 Tax=Arachis hypogaea TaxID=3818 RepID=A0A445DY87_ARAHY|nr:hypothetical protein Ahy_A03g014615 [Arachis hypogaea]